MFTLPLILSALALPPAPAAGLVTVTPADNGEALVNPDMGWTMHFYSNIVSVHVVDKFNFRDLAVGPPGAAPIRDLKAAFTVARVYDDGPRRFSRAAAAGACEVFVSVGLLDGTPRIALPLQGDDGQHRYRVGSVTIGQ